EAIFHAVRLDTEDPEAAWRAHAQQLVSARERLNSRGFAALRFKGPGTDLRVGLAEGHRWDGGSSCTPAGDRFIANMPTEEVFTAPHRERVDGVVRASKPLAYAGTLIEDFELTFEGGEVVSAVAGKGQEALDQILAADPGARRLGEVALVPVWSPIARMGLLFYQTLYDENAASHIALGQGYAMTLHGGAKMSVEERRAAGLNESLTHVDFMIGSADMDVDGETPTGEVVPVMRAGEWVIRGRPRRDREQRGRADLPQRARGPAVGLRLRRVPRPPGGRHRHAARGSGRAGPDAHGRGQVALLPGARRPDAGHHRRRLAPDRGPARPAAAPCYAPR